MASANLDLDSILAFTIKLALDVRISLAFNNVIAWLISK